MGVKGRKAGPEQKEGLGVQQLLTVQCESSRRCVRTVKVGTAVQPEPSPHPVRSRGLATPREPSENT